MYTFIINPNSKSYLGMKIWQKLRPYLVSKNIPFHYYLTEYPGHAKELSQEFTSHGNECTLVVLGGDGTLNEVLNGIQDFDLTTMAYIPTGSSNDFARSMNIPTNPFQAIDKIIESTSVQTLNFGILASELGQNFRFMVSSGIGFDAAVCEEVATSKIKTLLNRLHIGKLVYVTIALKQILKNKGANGTLTIDNKEKHIIKSLIFTSGQNHKYEGGGFMFCPEAKPNDDLLDLCVAADISKPKIILSLPKALKGKHTQVKGIRIFSGQHFHIALDRPMAIHTDGEYLGKSSWVEFSLATQKIKLIECRSEEADS